MKKNSVCCVIVTYNIGKDFYKCFNSIIDQVEHIIVIDNGSDQTTVNVLKKLEKEYDITVIFNSKNEGIAKALNLGVKYAISNKYEWILTMDNDSEATPSMIATMLNSYNYARNYSENIISIFPEYKEKAFYDKSSLTTSIKQNIMYSFIDVEITSGNLVKSDIFKRVGLFKEEYFIDYVDHEFCLRLLANGYKMIRAEGAILLHELGNSKKVKIFGKELIYTNHNNVRRYYITRNRMDVWKIYGKCKFDFCKKDKYGLIKDIFKIILFEKDKIIKIKYIFLGIRHYKKNIFGELRKDIK